MDEALPLVRRELMKMKPFDLKAALAGAKVVRRDGVPVKNFRSGSGINGFPFKGDAHFPDTGSPTGVTFRSDGSWSVGGYDSEGDLFLVDESPVRTAPFNLEAALKGEPVVTRDGRPVAEIKRFETVDRIYGVLDGIVTGWLPDGTSRRVGNSEIDLLMVAPEPKIREVWLNIYPSYTAAHISKRDADGSALHARIGKARRILIPEEE